MSDEERWNPTLTNPPPDGVVVETKIDDGKGVRNIQELKRQGRLWFLPDGSMYVYYTPTHWKELNAVGKPKVQETQ